MLSINNPVMIEKSWELCDHLAIRVSGQTDPRMRKALNLKKHWLYILVLWLIIWGSKLGVPEAAGSLEFSWGSLKFLHGAKSWTGIYT